MYSIRIRYGAQEEITRTYDSQPRLRDITGDNQVRAALGFGDNVRGLVSGVEMGPDSYIPNGSLVVIETRANQKAE